MEKEQQSLDRFEQEFGAKPQYKIVTPSRVNLIGEHVDYYDSFVLPMAIDNVRMVAWVRPRNDDRIRMHTLNLGNLEEPMIELSTQDTRSKLQWVQYVQGAIAMYAEEYTRKALKGFDILIDSSIPIGGGLSSSSVLTMTTLAALGLSNGFTDGDRKLSESEAIELLKNKGSEGEAGKFLDKICTMGCWAEYWYGTRGGAMDHFATTVSRKGFATLLDNRSFHYDYVPIPKELSIVVCNTMVRHNQLFNGFGERKKMAMSGFAKLHQHYPEMKNIRDVTLEMLDRHRSELTEDEYKKMRHPVTEKDRVFGFIDAVKEKNYTKLGQIIIEAFVSLRDDYDVSCDELNIMQAAAVNSPGCYGARITGGGFGGCIVAFVDTGQKDAFMEEVKKKYDSHPFITKQGIDSEVWEAHSGDGLTIEAVG
ncbi:MAG TPA: galactokinase family protein [bacterium]|nr:galactokinase family protein [bacterium]